MTHSRSPGYDKPLEDDGRYTPRPSSATRQRQLYEARHAEIPSSDRLHPLTGSQPDAHSLHRSKSPSTSISPPPPRRLSSGSACETCRRRKTKCDGGYPCAFCASNRIECIHRPTRRKKTLRTVASFNERWHSNAGQTSPVSSTGDELKVDQLAHGLSKQASCPSLIAARCTTASGQAQRQTGGVPQLMNSSYSYPASTQKIFREEQMPSVMDQLSCRTFLATVDQRQDFPIYPLSNSSPPPLREYMQEPENTQKQRHESLP